jgi:hypothetical protein
VDYDVLFSDCTRENYGHNPARLRERVRECFKVEDCRREGNECEWRLSPLEISPGWDQSRVELTGGRTGGGEKRWKGDDVNDVAKVFSLA